MVSEIANWYNRYNMDTDSNIVKCIYLWHGWRITYYGVLWGCDVCHWYILHTSVPTLKCFSLTWQLFLLHGPLTKYVKLRVAYAPRMRDCFPRHQLQRKPLLATPACITARHVPWCMARSLSLGGGKTFPAFPAHAQPAMLGIWYEAHGLNPLNEILH